jgi:hypothetical protein
MNTATLTLFTVVLMSAAVYAQLRLPRQRGERPS